MRSFANTPARVIVPAFAVWLSVCAVASAQATKTAAARQQFDAATVQDDKVRLLLTNYTAATPAKQIATQVSRAMWQFESLVRRFPRSGYADDALWRAASLAEAAYQRLNRPEDRDKALKMYRWLVKEYPTSTFVKPANAKIASIAGGNAASPPPAKATKAVAALLPFRPLTPLAMAAAPAMADSALVAIDAATSERATLTSIERVVLPNVVRVTLALDREVIFEEQRISGPERLFFDLKNVEVTEDLKDKVLSYGSDIVNKVRVGRHPDNTVRVVLDFEEVPRYTVFRLYNPFRLVVDAERSTPPAATTAVATTNVAAVEVDDPVPAPPVAESPPPPLPPLPSTMPSGPVAKPTPPAANGAGGFSIARQLGLSVSRIVIDPGHGGHDPGTPAKGLTEAKLTLDVALRLEKLLQKEPGVEVVLTRRTDVYVPLEERTAIANRSNADLFLSIHANSSRNTSANGVETFFLSFASSPDAEAIAARENSASEREMHQLPDIIKAISLNNKLDESRDLANMVQDALVANLKRSNKGVRSRGVKKAPFVVLIGAQMPSVLAEISFITNKHELQLLKTSSYKQRIAESLFNAVMKYRRSLKGAAATTVER